MVVLTSGKCSMAVLPVKSFLWWSMVFLTSGMFYGNVLCVLCMVVVWCVSLSMALKPAGGAP